MTSCSSQKTNVAAVSFHNTTAHYNAYFIARKKIQYIESSIEKGQSNDYNQILNVLPPLDSMISVTYAAEVEEVLKKASLIVQNHPNSKWVDDGYNLVGLARLYGYEYTHAIETFKWVNTNSKDDNTRHAALVNLMRTFIAYEEMNNAMAVSDYLEKEKLSNDNLKKLFLTRAWYYQNMEDYNNMVSNLVESTDLLKPKDNKARVYFIVGQVYQELGFESEAFNNYKKCLGSNPEYEISFYSKLNMARVSNLENTRDINKIRKDFKKLVKDAKNKEFVDRIYYEWGSFELRQNNLQNGIEKFNLSVQSGLNNPLQKGRSYLTLAEIYYDTLQNYSMAKLYYDSTIQILPKDYKGYDEIHSRQKVLEEFITKLNTIQLQDSLLLLGKMDSTSISEIIDDHLRIEDEKVLAEKEIARNKTRVRSNTAFENTGISDGASTWYFNNPSSLAMGQSAFLKIWGNRKLEDHWRRSVKNTQSIAVDDTSEDDTGDDEIQVEAGDKSTPSENDAGNRESRYNQLYASIPFSEEAILEANALVEEAMFKLGSLYNLDLNEEENAIETFEGFRIRFKESEHSPEVLFQLYLLYSDRDPGKAEQIKNSLIASYPESTFAKGLINPNYQKESQLANEILKKEYETAYKLFETGAFDAADSIINNVTMTYPDGEFIPRLKLLQILIVGKTQDLHQYQLLLGEFIEKYPEAEITVYANTLLRASDTYKESLIKLKDASFKLEVLTEHYFITVYELDQPGLDVLITSIESFNSTNYINHELKTGTLKLDNINGLILVQPFQNQEEALLYYDLFKAENSTNTESASIKFDTFVITKSNFEILYKTKELNTYKKFYSTNY